MRFLWKHGLLQVNSACAIVTLLVLPSFFTASSCAEELVTGSHDSLVERYLPDFLGVEHTLLGRADGDVQSLANNDPRSSNIDPGETQHWVFSRSATERPKSPKPAGLPSKFGECPTKDERGKQEDLRKRQKEPNFYISINTCDQPTSRRQPQNGAPDQLKLYISTTSSNKRPDQDRNDHAVAVDGGYGALNLTVTSDVYIGVSAPKTNGFSGIYNYEITASIDDYYAKYNDTVIANYVDSDKQSSLIYTSNLTTCEPDNETFGKWQRLPPPYSIFVSKQDDPAILGLHKSMCGLKKHAQVQGTDKVDRSNTLAGGGKPKQQFYVKELNASSSYYAVVGLEGTDGNSGSTGGDKVTGGGTIWAMTNFTTKAGPNCAVIYDLDFCSEIAYAVPSNSTDAADLPGLRATYDSYASSLYRNFDKSLQQIPCNTTASAQYSLAVTCEDCARAYKNWLCAVTIPRCEDFSNQNAYLLPRAVGTKFIDTSYEQQFLNDPLFNSKQKLPVYMNGSRTPLIDEVIKPGPYKELLPCEELCYGLVRSCPARLGFSCPLEDHGLNHTYGKLKGAGQDEWQCNIPGVDLSGASSLWLSSSYMTTATIASIIWISLT